jgi:ribosomal-protein-alanine N-acetyltransferase
VIEARLSDLGRLVELETAIFGAGAWSAMSLTAELRSPLSTLLLLQERESVLGHGAFRVVADEAEILIVGVLPEQRRRGLSRLLLGEIEARSREAGVTTLHLEVAESNLAARACYLAQGFQECGRRARYYSPSEDALLMRRRLDYMPRR